MVSVEDYNLKLVVSVWSNVFYLFGVCFSWIPVFLFLIVFFVAATIFLINVDLLVGGIILDGCWIICWVFVVMNESSRLEVKEGFDKDSVGRVAFALV